MRCPKCDYYWCWSCGLPVGHWIHTFSENPFGCKFTPTTGKAMMMKFFIFLLGLIFIPLGLLFIPLLAGIFYGFYGGCTSCYWMCCGFSPNNCCLAICKTLSVLLALPMLCIVVALGAALGALGSGLGAIAIVPFLVIHCFMFGRSIYWWNKNRIHSNIQESQQSKRKEMLEP
jgi:hypothetical protein